MVEGVGVEPVAGTMKSMGYEVVDTNLTPGQPLALATGPFAHYSNSTNSSRVRPACRRIARNVPFAISL